MDRTKIANTFKITASVIGSVIGAGFITGREIVSFFYGGHPFITGLTLFVIFFLFIYMIFKADSKSLNAIIEKSNYIVYFLSILIIGAMLSATDSLAFEIFHLNKNIPIFSISLLVISSAICLNGIEKVNKSNVILVPIMVIMLYFAIFYAGLNKNSHMVYKKKFPDPIISLGYAGMNVFLAQPFFSKIKKEKYVFSPFLVSFISALFLSVSVMLYLYVLNDECKVCDIPLLFLIKNSLILRLIVAFIIILGIFTTIIGAEYPIYNIFSKEKLKIAVVIVVALICFLISRLGFYVIVDKLYRALSYLSILYFAIFSCIFLITFLKRQLKRTLSLQKDIKARYLS